MRLFLLVCLIVTTGCSIKGQLDLVPYKLNKTAVLNEDMRNPDTRAAVDELIAQNALSDRNNPLEGPPTSFDLPLPPDTQGMQCEEPPQMEGQASNRPEGPLFADRPYMGSIMGHAVPGQPPWMEEVKLLECGIEDVLALNMVSGWLKDPNQGEGIWIIAFDRNGDKSADAWIQLYEGSQYPRYYGFDRSFNHEVNIIYEDTLYAGRTDNVCKGIEVYATMKDTFTDPKQGA